MDAVVFRCTTDIRGRSQIQRDRPTWRLPRQMPGVPIDPSAADGTGCPAAARAADITEPSGQPAMPRDCLICAGLLGEGGWLVKETLIYRPS
jgi:hypothetical protein